MPRPEKPLPTMATSISVVIRPPPAVKCGSEGYMPVTYAYVTSITEMASTSTRMSAEQRREQLLDVTKQLAFDRGFHAVSIEAVAREAGISRPIVYGHFTDLSGLLEALVERETARALGPLAIPQDLAGDPRPAALARPRDSPATGAAGPPTWRALPVS